MQGCKYIKEIALQRTKGKKKKTSHSPSILLKMSLLWGTESKSSQKNTKVLFIITYYAKFTELESINERKIGGKLLEKTSVMVFNWMK